MGNKFVPKLSFWEVDQHTVFPSFGWILPGVSKLVGVSNINKNKAPTTTCNVDLASKFTLAFYKLLPFRRTTCEQWATHIRTPPVCHTRRITHRWGYLPSSYHCDIIHILTESFHHRPIIMTSSTGLQRFIAIIYSSNIWLKDLKPNRKHFDTFVDDFKRQDRLSLLRKLPTRRGIVREDKFQAA